jgi:hypothetical protein
MSSRDVRRWGAETAVSAAATLLQRSCFVQEQRDAVKPNYRLRQILFSGAIRGGFPPRPRNATRTSKSYFRAHNNIFEGAFRARGPGSPRPESRALPVLARGDFASHRSFPPRWKPAEFSGSALISRAPCTPLTSTVTIFRASGVSPSPAAGQSFFNAKTQRRDDVVPVPAAMRLLYFSECGRLSRQ